jgi:hypothetical protein
VPPIVIPIDWTTFSPTIFNEPNIVLPSEFEEGEPQSSSNSETVVRKSPEIILQPPFDYVLLTDCVFSVLLISDLIRTIIASSSSKTEVICCHEIRDEEANALFVSELKKQFNVKRIARNKLHPEFRNDLIEVLSAKLKRTSLKAASATPADCEDVENESYE